GDPFHPRVLLPTPLPLDTHPPQATNTADLVSQHQPPPGIGNSPIIHRRLRAALILGRSTITCTLALAQ
ncbi:hypothetical protein HAX54_014578, partial [Datura stramonium]|nr:hypothetical protein [Datura stramonium]